MFIKKDNQLKEALGYYIVDSTNDAYFTPKGVYYKYNNNIIGLTHNTMAVGVDEVSDSELKFNVINDNRIEYTKTITNKDLVWKFNYLSGHPTYTIYAFKLNNKYNFILTGLNVIDDVFDIVYTDGNKIISSTSLDFNLSVNSGASFNPIYYYKGSVYFNITNKTSFGRNYRSLNVRINLLTDEITTHLYYKGAYGTIILNFHNIYFRDKLYQVLDLDGGSGLLTIYERDVQTNEVLKTTTVQIYSGFFTHVSLHVTDSLVYVLYVSREVSNPSDSEFGYFILDRKTFKEVEHVETKIDNEYKDVLGVEVLTGVDSEFRYIIYGNKKTLIYNPKYKEFKTFTNTQYDIVDLVFNNGYTMFTTKDRKVVSYSYGLNAINNRNYRRKRQYESRQFYAIKVTNSYIGELNI